MSKLTTVHSILPLSPVEVVPEVVDSPPQDWEMLYGEVLSGVRDGESIITEVPYGIPMGQYMRHPGMHNPYMATMVRVEKDAICEIDVGVEGERSDEWGNSVALDRVIRLPLEATSLVFLQPSLDLEKTYLVGAVTTELATIEEPKLIMVLKPAPPHQH